MSRIACGPNRKNQDQAECPDEAMDAELGPEDARTAREIDNLGRSGDEFAGDGGDAREIRVRYARRARRGAGGFFAQRNLQRLHIEQLMERARLLPPGPRGLFNGYYQLHMSLEELAGIHRTSRSRVHRQLCQLKNVLADRDFLAAVQFAGLLPTPLGQVARAYWIEGKTYRELATEGRCSMHRIRTALDLARARMAVIAAARNHVPVEQACQLLD